MRRIMAEALHKSQISKKNWSFWSLQSYVDSLMLDLVVTKEAIESANLIIEAFRDNK